MLIELTGHPCSGKTYILNQSQFKTLVFKKYSGIFKLPKLFFLTIYYILIDKLIRDIFHIVLISNDSFYFLNRLLITYALNLVQLSLLQ